MSTTELARWPRRSATVWCKALEIMQFKTHVLVLPVALIALLITIGAASPVLAQGDSDGVDFDRDVKPIFAKRCFACHGPEKQESSLRLDRRSSVLRGGDLGERAVTPGDAEKSFLIRVVSDPDSDVVMPPEGPRLSTAEVEVLRRWIQAGAKMPGADNAEASSTHWAFQQIVRPQSPQVENADTPVDAFLLARMAEHGLHFGNEANRRTLIRRLHLVLHGLPPSPADVQRFLQDDQPGAWRRLVDRALESPRYGERWARHWLDIVRFGETHGFETNRERPHAWRFRDWVIHAFNDDMPYDQFVRAQIAGDALGEPLGTGFLVAGPHDLVKSPDINLTLMQRQDELADLINTTGATFLGLTLGCARCHNHKFDPITQTDYYSIQAVFAGVQHGDRSLGVAEHAESRIAQLDQEIASLRRRLSRFIPESKESFLVLDEAPQADPRQPGAVHLTKPQGTAKNPPGEGPGQREDPGSAERAANISGGYTWWDNLPGRDVVAYQPWLRGPRRIWLSWGCGHKSHSSDAQYILDRDGDFTTADDQTVLATVNQQQFAHTQEKGRHAPISNQSLWSGFLDGGIHTLNPASKILLRGGEHGTAITADVIVFESVGDDQPESMSAKPAFRAAVSSRWNVERFQAVSAKRVRFTIEATNNGSQPCLDELLLFSGDKNIALASGGAIARSSSNLPGYAIHKLEHIHDGLTGNDHSWISNEPGRGWIEIELPEEATIDRIEWGRDRSGRYQDRTPTRYQIEVAATDSQWKQVASSEDRLPLSASPRPLVYRFDRADPEEAREGRAWEQSLTRAIGRREALSKPMLAYAGTFKQPGVTHRLYRGDPMAKREEVEPNTVEALGSLDLDGKATEQSRRVRFADWLTSRENPLTSRVIANRLWQFHFGSGIVDTPSDFGANGVAPTHPKLLDWLAGELVQHDWSLKHLHRVILLSRAWRQESTPRADGIRVDADTRLLWRFPPRRLEAEAIRDGILFTSGALNLEMGGPGFSAFEVQMENVRHYFPKKSFGPGDWRRMVYMTKVRQEQDAVFGAFDCPDASQVAPKRSRSTTPLQALNLLNSSFCTQQADLFAERLRREAGSESSAQVNRAYALAYVRRAEPAEIEAAAAFVDQHGLPAFCRALLNSNEFLFIP